MLFLNLTCHLCRTFVLTCNIQDISSDYSIYIQAVTSLWIENFLTLNKSKALALLQLWSRRKFKENFMASKLVQNFCVKCSSVFFLRFHDRNTTTCNWKTCAFVSISICALHLPYCGACTKEGVGGLVQMIFNQGLPESKPMTLWMCPDFSRFHSITFLMKKEWFAWSVLVWLTAKLWCYALVVYQLH